MVEHQTKKYRYERKYLINYNYLQNFISSLYSKNFSQKFPKRKINNIYFDNYDFTSLNENLDGLSIRKKYRIRWYGETFEKSKKIIEIKMKNEFLNKKKSYSIPNLQLKSLRDIFQFHSKLVSVLFNSKNLSFYRYLNSKRPTLFNRYERLYFENPINNTRITIDSKLEYFSPVTKMKFKEKYIVVEAKYNNEKLFQNNFKNLFLTRYSKYVKGTLQTSVHNNSY